MIKKTVKYNDFNGNQCEEVLYFHMSKPEMAKLEFGKKEGLSNYIKEAVESGDNAGLLEVFNQVILGSYGVKSEDGKRFTKTPALKEAFEQSPAYDAIFMEIATEPAKAEAFIKGIQG